LANRSRRLRWAGVLAVALVLAAPAGFFASGTHELRERIDGFWTPQPIEFDRRWVVLGEIAMLFGWGAAVLVLARQLRRRGALERALASTDGRGAASGGDPERLAARWQAWIERRYPLAFTGDSAGAALALVDPTRSPELAPGQWIGGSFEASLEREHRVALRAWVQRAHAGDPHAEPLEVLAHGVAARARWFELWLRLAGDEDGDVRAIDGIGRDVTERREAELERAMESAIDGEWFRNASLEVALMRVLRTLAKELFCDYVELWWLDDRLEVLHAGECWHAGGDELEAFARESRNRSFGKGVGLAGRVWAEASPLRLDDLGSEVDPRCARLAEVGPFASALGLPIQIGDRLLGVAVLLSGSRPLAPAALERLDRISAQLGRLVDRKRTERAVTGNEARKNAMLESALDCVITIDEEGKIVEFNPAAEKTFGRARSDVLGELMVELLVPEELRERHLEAFRRCLGPGAERPTGRRLELEGLRGDGSRFPIELSVTSIHVGETPSFTAYLRDISSRKELDRLKDELVSTVSHELRTPLTSMRGFVELLLQREFSAADQKRFLGIVDTEIRRLGKLIDDFLDLQRLEAGKLDYAFERQALKPLIEEAVGMFSHTSEKHQYVLALPESELPVRADADRLRQTLRNLISNATKYSPDGGTVTIAAEIRDANVRVSVRDQGIGMDEATQKKLFTRFYRADSTATRRIGGTGLGLALVKEIVEAHGGQVGVRSSVGKGSEFWFALPLASGG
jgi:PAS domain S-box-containing protein